MNVLLHVRIYGCMHIYMDVNAWTKACMYVCMNGCINMYVYVWMYVCLYGCIDVYVWMHIYR